MELQFTEEELMEFRDQLRKYKELGTKRVLRIVQNLSFAKITTFQLQQSKIAQTIQSLSSMSGLEDDENGPKIKDLCFSLITKWKKVVADERKQKEKGVLQPNVEHSKNNNTINQLPKIVKKQSSNQYSNCEIIENENPIYADHKKNTLPSFRSETRNKAIQAISNHFSKVRSELNVQQHEWVELVVTLEKYIFNRGYQVISYKTNVKEVLGMFTTNEIIIEVISKLLNKEATFQEVAEAKSTVFLTEQQKAEIKQRQEDQLALNDPNYYKKMRLQRLQGLEGEVCRACKKKTAFLVNELQTRSSDEPMTRFMECSTCGKSWRD